MSDIRGEYWIVNGSVDFADGDVGDYNHEALASLHVAHEFSQNISNLAEELEIEHDLEYYGELDTETLSNLLQEISEKLSDLEIMQKIGANKEAYQILCGGGDPRLYVMEYEGWIAVRSNNVEVYGYDEQKRKSLASGLYDILDQEGINEDDEELEFSLHDFKTGKSYYLSLEDINKPIMARPQSPIMTKGDRRFNIFAKDSEENKGQNNNKSVQNPWNKAAQQAKIIGPGQELWRKQSENFSFKEWMINELNLGIAKDLDQWTRDNKEELPFQDLFKQESQWVKPKDLNDLSQPITTRLVIPFEQDKIANSILDKIEKAGFDIDFYKGTVVKDKREIRLGKYILGKYSPLNLEEKTWWSHQGQAIESLKEAAKTNKYAIIISRNPIDIARMSDHDGWSSCHAPHREYFKCAVADAKGAGGIAYIVKKEDLQGINLQQPEIFKDKSRNVSGVTPISRLRLRKFVHKTDDYELAVPEDSIYGKTVPGFEETVRKWVLKAQDLEDKRPRLKDFKLMGGAYQDSNASNLFNLLFDDDMDRGEAEYGGEDDYAGMLNQYEEEVRLIEEEYEGKWDLCGYWASVEESDGQVYVSMSGRLTFTIPENYGFPKWSDSNHKEFENAIKNWAKENDIYNYVNIETHDDDIYLDLESDNDSTPDGLRSLLETLQDFEKNKEELRASFHKLMMSLEIAEPNQFYNHMSNWHEQQFKNFNWDVENDYAIQISLKEPINLGPIGITIRKNPYSSIEDPLKEKFKQELFKQLVIWSNQVISNKQKTFTGSFKIVPQIELENLGTNYYESDDLILKMNITLMAHHIDEHIDDAVNFINFLDKNFNGFIRTTQNIARKTLYQK